MRLCGCRPFFYHKLRGKVCDVSGLLCVAKHAKNVTKAPKEMGCECPSLCNTVTYLPQTPKFTKWYGVITEKRILLSNSFLSEKGIRLFRQENNFPMGLATSHDEISQRRAIWF